MAVVLVDGWPTDKVEEASRLARESGINIFFVTIEGPDDSERQNLVEANFVDKVRQERSCAGGALRSTVLRFFLLISTSGVQCVQLNPHSENGTFHSHTFRNLMCFIL